MAAMAAAMLWVVAACVSPAASHLLGARGARPSTRHPPPPGLSHWLFQSTLATANRSLYGRFVQSLANGTLPPAAFAEYLRQDNLYLSKYARAVALVGASSADDGEFVWLVNQSFSYLYEHDNVSYRNESLFEHEAGPVTVAYTSFFMQAALSGDRAAALASLLPCQKLYDYIFSTLARQQPPRADNPYRDFIEQYADPANRETTLQFEAYLDRQVGAQQGSAQWQRARYYFETALVYEAEFFDQAFGPSIEKPLVIWM